MNFLGEDHRKTIKKGVRFSHLASRLPPDIRKAIRMSVEHIIDDTSQVQFQEVMFDCEADGLVIG